MDNFTGHLYGCRYSLTGKKEDCRCEARTYEIALWLTFAALAVEVVFGFLSGSLALLSDAVHVAADSTHMVVALVVAHMAIAMRFREKRIRAVGALIGIALLVGGGVWIFYGAMERLVSPQPVISGMMFWAAFFGLAVNMTVYLITKRIPNEERTITHRLFSAHVISDTLLSVVVIASAVIIHKTGNYLWDPAMSVLASLYMVFYLSPNMYREMKNEDHHGHHHH